MSGSLKSCGGRCSGCALTKGAKANTEVTNRLTAMLAALGGIPFYCHEEMGWTPDVETYPASNSRVTNALTNLMTAPSLIHNSPDLGAAVDDCTATGLLASVFDEDRALIGATPICGGWKRAVRKLSGLGWFRDKEASGELRKMANDAIVALDSIPYEKNEGSRKELVAKVGSLIEKLYAAQKQRLGRVVDLEEPQ